MTDTPHEPGPGPAGPDATLLAVDAGLRAGYALYGRDGRLQWYRSRNYGSMARLKRAAYGLVADLEGLSRLVVEGGGRAAEPWLREAERRGVVVVQIHATEWRDRLMLPRNRRTGAAAKGRADALARRVIEWSGASRPTALRHDAAEAILVGLWGVLDAGWLPEIPAAVRKG
jgi:hypothetical protein